MYHKRTHSPRITVIHLYVPKKSQNMKCKDRIPFQQDMQEKDMKIGRDKAALINFYGKFKRTHK